MVKNIIFDFGGVIFNIDFNMSFEAFEKLGYKNPSQMFSQHNADSLFQSLEKGKISPGEFYTKLAALAPKPVTQQQLHDAWNAMLLNFRNDSLDFLVAIKKDYNLYLLSNTNAIHYDFFIKKLRHQTQYNRLEDFFTKAWYSHEIHRRKPDVETFEFVLKDAGIKAGETLFIDDTYSNLPNAEKIGIKTHLLKPGEKIEEMNYSQF